MTPTDRPALPQRRHLLQAAAAIAVQGVLPAARAHGASGRVTPPLAPSGAWRLRMHDGREATAASVLQGRVTAMQLMFTGCSAICPIQGALFAELERRVTAAPALASGVQLLSLSIDPLGDDPRALGKWLQGFGAGAAWKAASPAVRDLDPWLDFLQGRKSGADRHTAQVYLFDRTGRLVMRTVDFPTTAEVTRLLGELSMAREG